MRKSWCDGCQPTGADLPPKALSEPAFRAIEQVLLDLTIWEAEMVIT
jgi:hypothetical protein